MKTHDIRHRLTHLNRRILYIREISTQSGVISELDFLISDICALGDDLDKKAVKK